MTERIKHLVSRALSQLNNVLPRDWSYWLGVAAFVQLLRIYWPAVERGEPWALSLAESMNPLAVILNGGSSLLLAAMYIHARRSHMTSPGTGTVIWASLLMFGFSSGYLMMILDPERIVRLAQGYFRPIFLGFSAVFFVWCVLLLFGQVLAARRAARLARGDDRDA